MAKAKKPRTVQRMVDLSPQLLQAAKDACPRVDGADPTTREVLDWAVETFAPVVLAHLKLAGLGARPTGKRRPRTFADSTWATLEAMETEVGLPLVPILRAILTLASTSKPASESVASSQSD